MTHPLRLFHEIASPLSRAWPCYLVLASCAPAPSSEPRVAGASTVVVVEAPAHSAEPVTAEEPSATRQARAPFPESSLTGFAEQAAEVIDAAVAGRSLPHNTWPIDDIEEAFRDTRPDEDRGRRYEHVAFGMEIELLFERDPAAQGSDPAGVELDVVLFKAGLRIVESEVKDLGDSAVAQLPPWMAPVGRFAQELMDSVRSGQAEPFRLRDRDFQGMIPDDLLAELQSQSETRSGEFDELVRVLSTEPRIRAYAVDDIVMLSRSGAGELFGFRFDVDYNGNDEPEFDEPLVTAVRIWPRR